MASLEDWFYKYNGWSFARHGLFNFCNRAYYFHYICPAVKKPNEFDIYRLRRLKKLKSKFVLQGHLIHTVLENQIGQHYAGRTLNLESAQSQYLQSIDRFASTACDMLCEYFNGEKIDTFFFNGIKSSGLNMIDTFFGVIWPNFKELQYLKHEDFDSFHISSAKVNVKVDYVTKSPGNKIVISDWKTGKENDYAENKLQIGAYVLWAMEYYKRPSEEIMSENVFLSSGKMKKFQFSNDDLLKIQSDIIEDYLKMNNSYEIGNFSPKPSPKKCISCQFATICPDSLSTIALSDSFENKEDDPVVELLKDAD